jgi:hypothetical protein
MRYFVATIFAIIGLALPFELEAQNKELMGGYEKDLNSLFEQVFSTENKENERYNANEEVMVIMEEALLQRDSYKWKWRLRKGVSVLTSDDDKFRVITWAVVNDNNEFECFGYMQVLNENADVYEVCRLQDKTADIFNPGEVALTDQNWFGCIYTDLITTKYDGRYYYTLLGWNGGNMTTQHRVIEPVYFKRNSTKPSFGQMMFRQGKDSNRNLRRIILKYAKDININLSYEEQYVVTMDRIKVKEEGRMVHKEIDREKKEMMIVFDQVGPRVPGMEGMYHYYVPTGVESGFMFDRGRWVLKPNVHCKLKENKKLDVIEDNNLPSVYQKNEPTYKQKQ